jgi:pyruvate/oxaloacetate carboxyltransferase
MPNITAARPVAGQPIETAWGDQVHDAIEADIDIERGEVTSGTLVSPFAVINVVMARAMTIPYQVSLTANVLNGVAQVPILAIAMSGAQTFDIYVSYASGANISIPVTVQWVAFGRYA